MSDTCNGARACKRLLQSMAEAAGAEEIGKESWDAMSVGEREVKCKAYLGDCHQHLRNIIINAMSLKATSYLKEQLGDDLEQFSAYDRMSVDGNDLIRAVFNEFHAGGEYAKGKQREFHAWLKKHYPGTMYMAFERAMGSRQDLSLDGAVPIFILRKIMLEFLYSLVSPRNADNKLEKFLWRVLRCNEITALLRANTLFKYIISDPMRWLTGKSTKLKDWSIVSSSEVSASSPLLSLTLFPELAASTLLLTLHLHLAAARPGI